MALSSLPWRRRGARSHGAMRPRRHGGRRWLAVVSAVALLVAGTGAVLGVRTLQQNAVASAQADRDAALTALDGALAQARADGVADVDLHAVGARRGAILAEAAVGPSLLVFDGGQAAHLHRQADALRALVGDVTRAEGDALARARDDALAVVGRLDTAVVAADGAGLDATAERELAQHARGAVVDAGTANAVRQAVDGVAARTSGLESRTQGKLAAEEAAARPARDAADAEMATSRDVLAAAVRRGVDTGTLATQLDALQAELDSARSAAQFTALRPRIHDLVAPLANRLGIAELGAGRVIVISLDRQELTAYEDGVPYLTTVVTTGRPELPTVTGSFRVQTKYHPFTFYSEWAPGSPYWFAPSYSNYAMFFYQGYAVHDAPWRAAYGPGTNANGSHGCVNVPFAPMQKLFAWTPIGTRVIVH
jgi:lipoprotein-anchoring transpeptidase ErfK/SrfK